VVEIFWLLKIDMDTGLNPDVNPDSTYDRLEENDISDDTEEELARQLYYHGPDQLTW
jgi:hypothetical protein